MKQVLWLYALPFVAVAKIADFIMWELISPPRNRPPKRGKVSFAHHNEQIWYLNHQLKVQKARHRQQMQRQQQRHEQKLRELRRRLRK